MGEHDRIGLRSRRRIHLHQQLRDTTRDLDAEVKVCVPVDNQRMLPLRVLDSELMVAARRRRVEDEPDDPCHLRAQLD